MSNFPMPLETEDGVQRERFDGRPESGQGRKMEARFSGKVAAFAFNSLIPCVAGAMIANISPTVGFSIIVLGAVAGIGDLLWVLFPHTPWRRKLAPILLGCLLLMALGFLGLWYWQSRLHPPVHASTAKSAPASGAATTDIRANCVITGGHHNQNRC